MRNLTPTLTLALTLAAPLAWAQAPPDRYELQVYDLATSTPVGALYAFPATAATCTLPDPGPVPPPVINPARVRWMQGGVTAPMEICEHDATAHLATIPLGEYTASLQAFATDGAGTEVPSPIGGPSPPFYSGLAAPSGLSLSP